MLIRKKIVRDFHHMEKDFGDLTINIYLWIMLYAVVLWLISFCLKIFWILFFHSFPDWYWCLIEKFLSKCIYLLQVFSQFTEILLQKNDITSYDYQRFDSSILFIMWIRFYLKTKLDDGIKAIERYISSGTVYNIFLNYYIILYSKLKTS